MARLVEDPTLMETFVSAVMEPALPVVNADADIDSVIKELIAGRPAVLVRRNGKPEGIVTRFDVVHYLTGFRY